MHIQPKTTLELTAVDKIMEILGWGLTGVIWGLVVFNYQDLPDTIPIHFNAKGEADAFGHKSYIWILPLLGTGIFLGLTLLNRVPHHFNYLVNITPENATRQYRLATRMLRVLKLIIVFIFGIMVLETFAYPNSMMEGSRIWLLPSFIMLLFMPIIIYLLLSIT